MNSSMDEFCKKLGIWLHLSAPHTPAQNGVAEQGNRTIGQKAQAMLVQSGAPLQFWYEACWTAVFLSNRTSTSSLPANITPFKVWHYRAPSVSHLRVLGCQVFIHKQKETHEYKYFPISSDGILLGYSEDN